MNKSFIVFALTVSLASLSGCSWFRSEEDCPDCNIEINAGLDSKERFYCYGTQDRTWDCDQQKDDGKVATIMPKAVMAKPIETMVLMPPAPITESNPIVFIETPDVQQTTPGAIDLLDAPADSYTVQLIAMRRLDPVLDYAKQVGVDEPLYSGIINHGEPWYVLLLGIYRGHASAVEAKDSWIGTRVLKVDPWVRKLGPLQDAIRLTLSAE